MYPTKTSKFRMKISGTTVPSKPYPNTTVTVTGVFLSLYWIDTR